MTGSSDSLFLKEWFTLFKIDSLFLRLIRFKFVLFTILFSFLSPNQKSELLFIALLALCKRWLSLPLLLHKKSDESDLLLSLIWKVWRERFALVTLCKKSENSELLFRSLKNERFARKTKDQVPNPDFR